MPTIFSKIDPKEPEFNSSKSDEGESALSPNSSDQLKKHETGLSQSSTPSFGKLIVPRSDKELGLSIMNGQVQLEVLNWRTGGAIFVMSNQVDGAPKGGLNVTVDDFVIKMEFRIPLGFPDGMVGFMAVLQHVFYKPENLGIVEMKIGCEAVKQEVNNAKEQQCHVGWCTPWENAGCRVSWIRKKNDSMITYKFVNINKVGADEEMIMTVNEHHTVFTKISFNDPNLFGKWLAMPARIWLRTQWETRNAESDCKMFNKLSKSVVASTPEKAESKRKNKKKTQQPKEPKPTGTIPDSLPVSERPKTPDVAEESQAMTKSIQSLTIDTKSKSKKKKKIKRKSGAADTQEHVKEHNELPSQTEAAPEVQTDIVCRDVRAEREYEASVEQSTAPASLSPSNSPVLSSPQPTSPFGTARTHFSPPVSLPSSTPCSFITAAAADNSNDAGEVEDATTEQAEPGEDTSLCLTPLEEEVEGECVWPVFDSQGYLSDPETYVDYRREVLEAETPHPESRDAVRLGLFEGLQKIASPTSQPSRALLRRTPDLPELATEAVFVRPVQPTDEALDESSRTRQAAVSDKQQDRKLRDRQRRRRRAAALHPRGVLEWYAKIYPHFPIDGWNSPTMSTPETLEEETSPTAIQTGTDEALFMQAHWNLFRATIRCSKDGCPNQCSLMDGTSVVCPGCGPFSLVRYCGKQHLWEAVSDHWIRCGTLTLLHPVAVQHLPKEILMGPPMLPNIQRWDGPARHRQALWFASSRNHGDYFLFDEAADPMDVADQPASHEWLGCSSRTKLSIWFARPHEKDRFRRILAVCLFMAPEHPALVGYLYRLARDWLRGSGLSDNYVDSVLASQLSLEMGLPSDFFRFEQAERLHACETEWSGDPSPCSNPLCKSDRRPVFPYAGMSGFKELCDMLEGNFWLLRAHRTTHPAVWNMVERVCGRGFGRAPRLGRVYPRGDGWDGAGTGPMWVELPWGLDRR